jgi:pyroglutamyl-peptidase
MRTLLITGFGPFLDVAVNPSWEAIKDLDGAVIGSTRVKVAQLVVAYAGAPQQLQAAIDAAAPDLVLCLGVAGDAALRLESTARNADTAAAPDAAGEVRAGRAIREGGAATLPTRLPLDVLRRTLVAEGYEVMDSDDAGGYLCNHVFYELLVRRPTGVAGFVHVPPTSERWPLARLQRAVRRIVAILDADGAR